MQEYQRRRDDNPDRPHHIENPYPERPLEPFLELVDRQPEFVHQSDFSEFVIDLYMHDNKHGLTVYFYDIVCETNSCILFIFSRQSYWRRRSILEKLLIVTTLLLVLMILTIALFMFYHTSKYRTI